mgnify:CR=1 FL=1
MTITAVQHAQRQASAYTAWDYLRFLLLALLIAVPLGLPYFVPQEATLSQLTNAAGAGQVDVVEFSEWGSSRQQPSSNPSANQVRNVQLHFTQGHKLLYVEALNAPEGLRLEPSQRAGHLVIRGDLRVWAEENLHMSATPTTKSFSPTWTVGGRNVPGWIAGLAISSMISVLYLIMAGPYPWRATRWAWFWLVTTPVGLVAFLVLSGRFPLIALPKWPQRRLIGIWAFLLSFPLHGLRLWF